jgi:hypothetical protein
MILSLLLIPLIGVLLILPLGDERSPAGVAYTNNKNLWLSNISSSQQDLLLDSNSGKSLAQRIQLILKNSDQILKKSEQELMKKIALFTSLLNLLVSIYMWFQFDYNTTSYQFVYEFTELSFCHFHVGVDGISLYFVLLTTFITPICILSN